MFFEKLKPIVVNCFVNKNTSIQEIIKELDENIHLIRIPLNGPLKEKCVFLDIASEVNHFALGMFILAHSEEIPLHDHPGMHVITKVLRGKIKVNCYSKETFNNQEKQVKFKGSHYLDSSSKCFVTFPIENNLHSITSLEGDAVFLDIFAPSYDEERPCTYYLEPEEALNVNDLINIKVRENIEFRCLYKKYPPMGGS
jgi:hypothetical protein